MKIVKPKVTLNYKKDELSIFSRKKDEIFIGVLLLIVGAIIGKFIWSLIVEISNFDYVNTEKKTPNRYWYTSARRKVQFQIAVDAVFKIKG